MSPTILREAGFRLYFFSREEARPHVHVQHSEGEAKFWIEPTVELASSIGMKARTIGRAETLVIKRLDEIHAAWNTHFGS